MKRGVKVIILLAVIAVIIVGYLVVKDQVAKKDAASHQVNLDNVLSSLTLYNIMELTWERNGETMTLVRDDADSPWYAPEDPSLPLDQSKIYNMVFSMAGLLNLQAIEDVSDLSVYGLAQPSLHVQASDGGSNQTVVDIGDYNQLDEMGVYYSLIDGDATTVYVLDSSIPYAFNCSLLDLVQQDEMPSLIGASALTWTTADGAVYQLQKEADSGDWSLTDDTATPNVADLNALSYALSVFAWQGNAAYLPTAEELAAFGLEQPSELQITLADGTTFDVYLSADGQYAMLADQRMVYQIDSGLLSALTAIAAAQ